MKRSTWMMVSLLVTMAMITAACGDDDDETTTTTVGGDDTTTTTAAPKFDSGTTMATLQEKGKITVGTKFDQPGFGQQNPATSKVEGFDVEIAKLIAVSIFGGDVESVDSKIEFVEAVSANREPFIKDGRVDIVVATYTINDKRKEVVDFAGPYFVAKQDIMVKADNTTIKGVEDLNGKSVCTVKGSTSEKNLLAKAPQAKVELFPTYSECAQALVDDRVVAVTTDNTILAGLIKANTTPLKLVENPFSDEPYGIGVKKGDDAFRAFVNDRLEEIYEDGQWEKSFEATLGKIGLKTPEPPTIDRYTAGAAATTSTSSTGGPAGATASSTTKP
ncbi:MAG TPA: glutamate ABC transporter substrate-binding protein [Acidimicrobiales bacterium]|nr:glutamate ABC transporter substrate-binding protein [Acidimicrobiales bacterium]